MRKTEVSVKGLEVLRKAAQTADKPVGAPGAWTGQERADLTEALREADDRLKEAGRREAETP